MSEVFIMFVSGYAAMMIVGIVLGMIGGGGAILTMPILVYLFSIPPILATSYSLFIVGCSSVFGVWRYHLERLVDYRTSAIFVLPSFLGTMAARRVLLPVIPDVIASFNGFLVTKNQLVMGVFAVIMVAASTSMIRPMAMSPADGGVQKRPFIKLVLLGFLVGFVAGFVGAGGGFLIIPALVIWGGLTMKVAVPTSLFIIALNSLVAFAGDLWGQVAIDWAFLGILTSISSVGLFAGVRLSRGISPARLKVVFGWFLLLMGGWILVRQFM